MFSPQLANALSTALGPHAASELASLIGNAGQPQIDPMDFKALTREVLDLQASLDKALIRIEHLERVSPPFDPDAKPEPLADDSKERIKP